MGSILMDETTLIVGFCGLGVKIYKLPNLHNSETIPLSIGPLIFKLAMAPCGSYWTAASNNKIAIVNSHS
jgi:hypothetical protein